MNNMDLIPHFFVKQNRELRFKSLSVTISVNFTHGIIFAFSENADVRIIRFTWKSKVILRHFTIYNIPITHFNYFFLSP